MKNTERFSNRVENYVKYRPTYPVEIISYLHKHIGLSSEWAVADIGSGTGISSKLFLDNKNIVYGVEPNKPMREAAENFLRAYSNFKSIIGTAEETTLPKHSVDMIVAGQAFHWFDLPKTKVEFQRILKPDHDLVLMWNDRKLDSPFLKGYEDMLKKYSLGYARNINRNFDENLLKGFYAPREMHVHAFEHAQTFDFEGLKGRLLSSSNMPLDDHPDYKPMLGMLKEIFDSSQVDGKVQFEYECKIFYGKIH